MAGTDTAHAAEGPPPASPAVTTVGTGVGLYIGDSPSSIGDGNADSSYTNNGIRFQFNGSGIALVANQSFIDFDAASPVIPQQISLSGYWRQQEDGSLGDWSVLARTTTSDWVTLTTPQSLSTTSTITIPTGSIAYDHYRLLYLGGSTASNGGRGAGAISEIRLSGLSAPVESTVVSGAGSAPTEITNSTPSSGVPPKRPETSPQNTDIVSQKDSKATPSSPVGRPPAESKIGTRISAADDSTNTVAPVRLHDSATVSPSLPSTTAALATTGAGDTLPFALAGVLAVLAGGALVANPVGLLRRMRRRTA
ncbi:hypothetical protein [Microbacterium sp. PMB16]|uniref:hypothetical protein n=1 Tax=Microbacterium sp. PMB16 TaxID=3120157 RepID=UPI003F4C3768